METNLTSINSQYLAHKYTLEVSIIIPANNEATSIAGVIRKVQKIMDAFDLSYEIIVVDDGSEDETSTNALQAGAKVIQHPYNIGNGAAVKTGIRHAQGKILIMLDGDGQHPPEAIPSLLEKLDRYHMAVGARARNSETSFHRDVANRIYNWLASYVCGRKIDDLTSGFRAVRSDIALEFISLFPNTFSYPTTITLAVVRSGYSLTYVPVKMTKRMTNSKSKIKILRDGFRFLLIISKITTLYSPMRIFLPVSFLTFSSGFAYGVFKIFALDARYGPTSAMLMVVSVLIFLIGLVSEQVAQLRFDSCKVLDDQRNVCIINKKPTSLT